ncbi:MAG: Mo-dependent nitrogenase C-terminal domain-containing protein [Cyanobacteria bacterium P01_D01_bin.156]
MAILTSQSHSITSPKGTSQPKFPRLLKPVRNWLDNLQITNRRIAYFICRVIPSSCPFERDISIFGKTIHIPALCRINPVYDELVSLRLRALTYLAETCSEDITNYVR